MEEGTHLWHTPHLRTEEGGRQRKSEEERSLRVALCVVSAVRWYALVLMRTSSLPGFGIRSCSARSWKSLPCATSTCALRRDDEDGDVENKEAGKDPKAVEPGRVEHCPMATGDHRHSSRCPPLHRLAHVNTARLIRRGGDKEWTRTCLESHRWRSRTAAVCEWTRRMAAVVVSGGGDVDRRSGQQ